ncbi:hypothetical protein PISL3812_08994 [Talaromyces islandicus]|uniref:N-acetyltransferase domain-containing protein n=1 Tax=Talaromyces islandicus TaxID=28573 RepID=A0A0U1MAE4_TALIS|nr:hypothetical protein PISL3812_08994 [Talaromyces islandicus]
MDPNTSPVSAEKFFVRRMVSQDIPIIARIACTEYFDSPLNEFLCPHRHKYPNDLLRRFVLMIQARYLIPRTIGFVAVSSSSPDIPVGYVQSTRLGDDEAAKLLLAEQASIWLTFKTWWSGFRTRVERLVWPDRSLDPNAMRVFDAAAMVDDYLFWDSDDMKAKYANRWHVQGLVVSSRYQRRGLGRMLMSDVLQRAQDECVVVGLEASPDGEKLYRSLGFELRGRSCFNFPDKVGGIMMWSPNNL